MKDENVILEKTKAFALRIVKLSQYLINEKREYVLSKQVLRSGTSIGANVKESICAQTKPDFYCKMYIAYKEASETEYWLELLYEGGFIDEQSFHSVYSDCKEIVRLLASITKTQKDTQ